MDISQYFTRPELVEGTAFSLYGPLHLMWIAIAIIFLTAMCLWYRKKDEVTRKRIFKIVAYVIAIQEVCKLIFIIIVGSPILEHLPLHLCGVSIMFILYAANHPSPFNYELLYSISLPGALMALLFCDWTNLPAFHVMNIHSFTIHIELMLPGLLLISSRESVPNYKQLPKVLGLVGIIAIPIYFINKLTGSNFFFINYPSPGSPLVIMEKFLGNPGYILGIIILLMIIWVFMYSPFILLNGKSK